MLYLVATTTFIVTTIVLCAKLIRYQRRARYDAICPNCDYEEHPGKTYDPNEPCVECGITWPEADRHNTRRWRTCVLGIAALLALSGLSSWASLQSSSALQQMPGGIIVRLAPTRAVDEGSGVADHLLSAFRDEVDRRVRNDELSASHLSIMAKRIFDRLDREGALVRTRSRWPREVPFRVRPVHDAELQILGRFLFRITATDGTVVLEQVFDPSRVTREFTDPTGVVPDFAVDGRGVTLNVEARRASDNAILAARQVRIPIEFVSSWTEVLNPVEIDHQAVLRSHDITNYAQRGTTFTTVLLWPPARPDLAAGFRVEVVQGDRVLAERQFFHDPDVRGFIALTLTHPVTTSLPARRLRFTPDPATALRDFEKDAFWMGEPFEIPIGRGGRF